MYKQSIDQLFYLIPIGKWILMTNCVYDDSELA